MCSHVVVVVGLASFHNLFWDYAGRVTYAGPKRETMPRETRDLRRAQEKERFA